jgi:hypothetical protein
VPKVHRVKLEKVTGGAPMEAVGHEYRSDPPGVEPRMAFLCGARKNAATVYPTELESADVAVS